MELIAKIIIFIIIIHFCQKLQDVAFMGSLSSRTQDLGKKPVDYSPKPSLNH